MARTARESRSSRPRGRPRAEERAPGESRAALLAAATGVFAERGYRGAGVGEIAAAAGLSKGTFYWNFESKDDLFFALVEERLDRPIREVAELLESSSAGEDMSEAANRRFLEVFAHERDTILLDHEYWALAARDPELRRRYAERQRRLREALGAALDARARRLGAPEFSLPSTAVAGAFLALMSGLARAGLIDPDATPPQLFGEMVATVYAGMVARAEAGDGHAG
ncbi:MAG TPA: helix-turn-helix domain-containing protein [Thermoleophilaceae bacterium]|nr:helix-turn-helix domain-containing protein [Thermoleophilaceae bacterium]